MANRRQMRHSEDMRGRILETTQRIISEEGIDAVSIRRVADDMGYTSAILYHYFENKGQLLSCAVYEGYKKILASVEPPESGLSPADDLRASFKNFVDSAMRVPNEYKAFILNYSSGFLAEISVLDEDGHKKSPTLAKIVSTLERGVETGELTPCDVELTAKILWSAMFGLFFRFVVERDITQGQRDALIQRQLDVLMNGIAVK
jgi:AcrR family transcriptional regulator